MKCKFYSDEIDKYSYDKCKYNGFPTMCAHKNDFENCTCFEPIEYEKESYPYQVLYKDRLIDKRTLIIQNCDKIILKPKSLEVEVKIEEDNFDDFDFIEINGHKFKKV